MSSPDPAADGATGWGVRVDAQLPPQRAQGSDTLTCRPPRKSTRCIIEPPSICEAPCHFTLLVTYQTPSGTREKEKLPEGSQLVLRRVET
jgi:hypothetical protein